METPSPARDPAARACPPRPYASPASWRLTRKIFNGLARQHLVDAGPDTRNDTDAAQLSCASPVQSAARRGGVVNRGDASVTNHQ